MNLAGILRASATVIGVVLFVVACGSGTATTRTAPSPEAIAAYCEVVEEAPTVGFDEALHLLDDVALPAIEDLIDGLLGNEWSQDAWFELGDFNEETCGLRWP